jgi:hypothetical protein
MTAARLTSADVIYALVAAKAVGKLTVTGDNPVVITGTRDDRDRARAVLIARGLHCTPSPERDEWSC